MPVPSGTTFGPYEIGTLIGAGDMGKVYRARDTKLDREVAIKVLPEAFAQDTERLARFEREARLLAALNHPNIATIHGLEESEGIRFLVMELVEGETLAERIARGPIPLDEVLPLFKQIAEGLEAAHEKGVVHRDLKPANVKLTREGKPKILDFGLAKEYGQEVHDSSLSESPTMTRGTATSVILGTAPYMSPEQARGKTVDKRSDIWAFGCCLYEAVTGQAAFLGETVSDTVAKILEREPDWQRLPEAVPAPVRRLLKRCLAKKTGDRLHDIADARIEMSDSFYEPVALIVSPSPRRRLLTYVAAALLALVTTILGWTARSFFSTREPVVRLTVNLPPGEEIQDQYSPTLLISRDGTRLVYSTGFRDQGQFYVRSMDDFVARLLKVEGGKNPFLSPDGQWLGFFAGGRLQKVSMTGGAPLTISEAPQLTAGASWGPDGSIVLSSVSIGLQRVSATGGPLKVITILDHDKGEAVHWWPYFLPDDRGLIFTVRTTEGFRPAALSFQTGNWHFLEPIGQGRGGRYVPTGHLVYAEAGQLLAAPFDLNRLELSGTPVPILDGVHISPTTGLAYFDVSDTGTLAYLPRAASSVERILVLVDRAGNATPILEERDYYLDPHFSPDGKRLAVNIRSQDGRPDIWIFDVELGTRIRLTSSGDSEQALWTPDGNRITSVSAKAGPVNIYWMPVDGSGTEEPLLSSPDHQALGSWTSDGKRLAFTATSPDTGGSDIWVLTLGGEPSRWWPPPLTRKPPASPLTAVG